MTKEIYTLVIRSSKVSTDPNSGTRVNGKYRVNWAQILPNKYRRFKVSSYFLSAPTTDATASTSTTTVCIHTNLTASSSYTTLTQGRTNLLNIAKKQVNYLNGNYFSYQMATETDYPPLIIDYPFESYLNVALYDIDGSTAITVAQLDKDFILILTFEPIIE